MQARQFEQFLQHLSSLTRRQRDRLLELLQSAARLDRVLEIVEQPAAPLCCPHCRASKPYRHGHAHGLQRYRCRSCRRGGDVLDWRGNDGVFGPWLSDAAPAPAKQAPAQAQAPSA